MIRKLPFKSQAVLALLFIGLALGMAGKAGATPALMAYYKAPACTSCHTTGVYTKASGTAGLQAYLAAQTPTCTPPQVLQNNVCVTPTVSYPAPVPGTVVRMRTSLGPIDMRLYDTSAPRTVTNFLSYVTGAAYTRSIIHRSVPGFIVQGGGFKWIGGTSLTAAIPQKTPVVNEFSPLRSNLRGTIAMAKLGGNPNSATNQWFFNLANNAANLDNQNGGFTVFGKVTAGMAIVDKIAALPTTSYGGAFTNLPLAKPVAAGVKLAEANIVSVKSVSANRSKYTTATINRVFDYLESVYPDRLAPANDLATPTTVLNTTNGYTYRYYADTKSSIRVTNGTVYYYGPASNNTLYSLGTLASLYTKAVAAGY